MADGEQLGRRVCDALMDELREQREPFRAAAAERDLKVWTALLTEAMFQACKALGWRVAARGYKLKLLPVFNHEYLSLDGMAFDLEGKEPTGGWLWPVAVFELENEHTDSRTAYSLWKVLNVTAPLRVVVAYRPDWDAANALPGVLTDLVIRSMPVERWSTLEGEVVLVVGSRSDGASFPYDYFRFWRFDRGIGKFVRLGS